MPATFRHPYFIDGNMNRILVLGAGQMQVPVIKKIKERGDCCIVADFDKHAPGMKYADVALGISTNDKDGVLAAARECAVNGILTTSDYPVNVVAFVARELSLPAMSVEVAAICTNKYLQRQLFSENRINCPFYKLITGIQELVSLDDFPYMIKPVDSSASRGVKKVNSRDELTDYFPIASSFSKSGKVIVEKFIEGREFSVETLSQNGRTSIIAITEKITKGEEQGFFVEDAHLIPANLSVAERCLIETEVLKAISVIGLDNCPTHTEIKLNTKGAWIIEIACRLGGDNITSDLVPLATGVDMLENLIRLSVGEPVDTSQTCYNYAAIQFFNQENYDKCVAFLEHEDRRIVRKEIGVKHNRVIASSMDRMGYCIMQTQTREEIYDILSELN